MNLEKIKCDIMSIGEGNYKQMRTSVQTELGHMSKLTSNIGASPNYNTLFGKKKYKLVLDEIKTKSQNFAF